jgi:hypothetical protein
MLVGRSSVVSRRSQRQLQRFTTRHPSRRQSATHSTAATTTTSNSSSITKPASRLSAAWKKISNAPIEYASIPCVAAFVGITTNWMGVKMLFYPIQYWSVLDWQRWPNTPYGLFGWQGVVPALLFVKCMQTDKNSPCFFDFN